MMHTTGRNTAKSTVVTFICTRNLVLSRHHNPLVVNCGLNGLTATQLKSFSGEYVKGLYQTKICLLKASRGVGTTLLGSRFSVLVLVLGLQ